MVSEKKVFNHTSPTSLKTHPRQDFLKFAIQPQKQLDPPLKNSLKEPV